MRSQPWNKVWAREGGRECCDCDSYCQIALKDKSTRQKQKEELAKELEDDERQAHWVQGPYKEFCNEKKDSGNVAGKHSEWKMTAEESQGLRLSVVQPNFWPTQI